MKRGEERFGKFGNVAIKREQRLLADYAEREQRKACEAGLSEGRLGNLGRVGSSDAIQNAKFKIQNDLGSVGRVP